MGGTRKVGATAAISWPAKNILTKQLVGELQIQLNLAAKEKLTFQGLPN